jgi:hypothetical protein
VRAARIDRRRELLLVALALLGLMAACGANPRTPVYAAEPPAAPAGARILGKAFDCTAVTFTDPESIAHHVDAVICASSHVSVKGE